MTFPYDEVSRLVRRIGKLQYGESIRFARHEWQPAIPTADPLQQVLLVSAGHRPETEREPLDWVRFWINGTSADDFMTVLHAPFVVMGDPMAGDLIVHLPEKHCPKCGGSGVIRSFPPIEANAPIGPASISMTETVEVRVSKCDHRKEPGDKTNVSWP